MDDMVLKAGKFEDDLRDVKKEISDLLRQIQRLNGEMETLKRRVSLQNSTQLRYIYLRSLHASKTYLQNRNCHQHCYFLLL